MKENDFVFEENGLWYFWDETGIYEYGPYQTEEEARKAIKRYCEEVLGN